MTVTSLLQPAAVDDARPINGHGDDDIYPVHLLDGTKVQHCIMVSFFKFNDILDHQQIKQALTRVLQIGDWRKLGGRFRTKGQGLEIHVPRQYTAARPAFNFAFETCPCRFAEHPLGGQLPQEAADAVSLSAHLGELREYGYAPGFPNTMDDLVDRDAPQLSFKITHYTDATLLATTFSHCTWDVSGALGFMKALQLVLDGREDEVPPMLGASSDMLAEVAGLHERGLQEDVQLKQMMSHRSGDEKECVHRSPQPPLEERLIGIPMDTLKRLRSLVIAEDDDEDTWMTYQPDELFVALVVQQIARASPTPRSINMMNILNARLVVPSLSKARGVYTQNMVLLAPNKLSPNTTAGGLGPIAVSQRACIGGFTTQANIARSLRTFLGAIQAGVDTTALTSSDDDAAPLLINNLVRFTNELDIDLSSAVLRQGEGSATRNNALGTVDFCYLTIKNPYDMMRITTLGAYDGTACWMFGELPARAWELLQETLDELGQ